MDDRRPLTHVVGQSLVRIICELPPHPAPGERHTNFYAVPANPRYRNCDACACIGSPRARCPQKNEAARRAGGVPKVTIRHSMTNDGCTAFHNDAGRPSFASRAEVVYDVAQRAPTPWRVVAYQPSTPTRGKVVLQYIGPQ